MTRSSQEQRASDALARSLVPTALPQVRVVERRRFRGSVFRLAESLRPRLPGYLFARISDCQVRSVREADGVLAIVGVQGVPIRVPDAVVDEIMTGSDEYGVVETRDYTKAQSLGPPGSPVSVQWPGNPYDGLVGALAALEGKRVRLWLRVLGGESSVRVPLERVRPAASAA